ncbi:XXYS1_4_G0031110.mRNA.1.CDS.1 [Saccharomyces cerevisiae]|nr:XXYS1_4_G0031110.mRNA.1.CDS.1 [Saccharomyces cerevisiae]
MLHKTLFSGNLSPIQDEGVLKGKTTIKAKVHGSLARAGKVKSQTPKVEKTEKPKKPKGRAYKRLLYTRRFVNVTLVNGKRRMNPGPSVQ